MSAPHFTRKLKPRILWNTDPRWGSGLQASISNRTSGANAADLPGGGGTCFCTSFLFDLTEFGNITINGVVGPSWRGFATANAKAKIDLVEVDANDRTTNTPIVCAQGTPSQVFNWGISDTPTTWVAGHPWQPSGGGTKGIHVNTFTQPLKIENLRRPIRVVITLQDINWSAAAWDIFASRGVFGPPIQVNSVASAFGAGPAVPSAGWTDQGSDSARNFLLGLSVNPNE